MKILHALVGYLAATALPFHPFSFASPLATIDYDGYDTTQNQSDKALMKRVPGDIIEARQLELIPTVFVIAAIIAGITAGILWIVDDDPVRGNDVLEFPVDHFDLTSSVRNGRRLPKILSTK